MTCSLCLMIWKDCGWKWSWPPWREPHASGTRLWKTGQNCQHAQSKDRDSKEGLEGTLPQLRRCFSKDCLTFFNHDIEMHQNRRTRWFKYDRDYLCVNKSQFVPVIFEPPCIWITYIWKCTTFRPPPSSAKVEYGYSDTSMLPLGLDDLFEGEL
jgi:hypothetical protein